MTAGERFKNWIDSIAQSWAERLKTWLGAVLGWGIEVFFDVLGKATAPKLKPLIDKLEETKQVPAELQPILDELKEPKGEAAALFSQSAGQALIGGAIGKIIDALLLPLAYSISSVTRNVELADSQMLALWLRKEWTDEELDKKLSWLGVPTDNVENLKKLAQVRLDPASVITAWRRDPTEYEKLFKDLRDQGWDEDRIKALKFITLFLPSSQDIVSWYAKEVFEPDMVTKYGLLDELPSYELTDFPKIGVSSVHAKNFWIAHWEHASWMQVVEMLHRGLIKEEDVYEWFRLVEIPPFWRDLLIKTAYTWPTRVDVRRWWDMRTIDEARLKELYEGMGYRGQNLEDYIKWTKVYTDFPMMMTRFKNGWITEEDIRSWLASLDIPADRIDQFIEEKTKPEKAAQVESERQATATEIMKGVKKGIITWDEGVEMLGDLGYDTETAEFKLKVYLGVTSGSPETYSEFKEMTQYWRKAQGLPAKIPSEDLIQAEKVLKKAGIALRGAESDGKTGEKLAPFLKAVSDSEYHYRQLLLQWKAQST